MNHYPHHIGDFNNGTRHLTRIERSIYRDLIELYYDTEAALPSDIDVLARRIIARSEEERTALVSILSEFFTLDEGAYKHTRCDEEIAAYQSRVESARSNGQRGGRPSKPSRLAKITDSVNSANPAITGCKANQNQNQNQYIPPTPKGDEKRICHEPVTNRDLEKKEKTRIEEKEQDFLAFWQAYPRKTGKGAAWKSWKNASLPKLEVILNAIRKARQSPDWQKERGAFIPHPATWLNQARWEDEGIDYAALAGKRDTRHPSAQERPIQVDEQDALSWLEDNYSVSDRTITFKEWPKDIQSQYLNSKQLQAA